MGTTEPTNSGNRLHCQAHQTQIPQLSSLAEVCGNVGKPIRLESPTRLLSCALRSRRCRRWLSYVLRREFHTFLSRTQYALGSQASEGPVCGPAFEEIEGGNWTPCQRTLARIQDTQQMSQVWQRWAVTALDSEIFLLGWTAGERWAAQRNNSAGTRIRPLG